MTEHIGTDAVYGRCVLQQGDCLELMRGIPDASVDMVLTDVPYGVVNRSSNGLRKLDKGKSDVETFAMNEFLQEIIRLTKGSIYVFCGTEQVSEIRKTLAENGFTTRVVVWEKTNPSPMNGQFVWLSGIELCIYGKRNGAVFNEHCKNTVFRAPCGRNKLHPTEKPLSIFERFVLASSNPGDTVLDPCMGSGTTGVACVNTGRRFIGMELDTGYFETAKQRIEEAWNRRAANE